MDEDHFLAPFLEEKLPTLGLDPETYGPYLLGLLPVDEDVLMGGGESADEDEWEGVLELLQASSESHSDDEAAWKDLKTHVLERYQQHLTQARQRKAEEDAQRQEAAKQALEAVEDKKDTPKEKSSVMDDEAKKALLARFAYEEEEDNEEGEGAGVNVNKAAAKEADVENAKELRKQKGATKKEEQQKTKQAKQDKVKMKEERRKKATKGERKR